MSWCGFEDSVVNHILLIKDMQEKHLDSDELKRRTQEKLLQRRVFDVICIQNVECLSLFFHDIDHMKKDFANFLSGFIKKGIQ